MRRAAVSAAYLTNLGRQLSDDPVIVETWL